MVQSKKSEKPLHRGRTFRSFLLWQCREGDSMEDQDACFARRVRSK